jgi:hypothetical protein
MDKKKNKFVEQIEVAGEDLVAKVKELFADANAKRVILRDSEGRELVSIPLTLGMAGGAIAVLAAPALAAVAAVGGAIARVRVDIERDAPPPGPADDDFTDPSAGI